MPDNYSGDFLSHNVEPIEQMLRLRAQVELEIPDRVAPIGQKLDLLIHLEALRLEKLKETALGFLIIGLHEGKTFA